jgi:Flp pilus assembly protein TadG
MRLRSLPRPTTLETACDASDGNVRPRTQRRRGAAVVELAVCLPVIILLVFGSIEAASFIFLKQSLSAAAYEAAREAIRFTSNNVDSEARATNVLDARNVQDYTISFPNGESGSAARGSEIVVIVTAPTQSNSPLAGQFIANRDISARVVMVKE